MMMSAILCVYCLIQKAAADNLKEESESLLAYAAREEILIKQKIFFLLPLAAMILSKDCSLQCADRGGVI